MNEKHQTVGAQEVLLPLPLELAVQLPLDLPLELPLDLDSPPVDAPPSHVGAMLSDHCKLYGSLYRETAVLSSSWVERGDCCACELRGLRLCPQKDIFHKRPSRGHFSDA